MIVGQLTINDRINIKEKPFQITAWGNIPDGLRIWNSYGVPGSDFEEPVYICGIFGNSRLLNQFCHYPFIKEGDSYYPALGYYWSGFEWKEIEGYVPPRFAPGFSWKNEELPFLFIDDEEYYLVDQFEPKPHW